MWRKVVVWSFGHNEKRELPPVLLLIASNLLLKSVSGETVKFETWKQIALLLKLS